MKNYPDIYISGYYLFNFTPQPKTANLNAPNIPQLVTTRLRNTPYLSVLDLKDLLRVKKHTPLSALTILTPPIETPGAPPNDTPKRPQNRWQLDTQNDTPRILRVRSFLEVVEPKSQRCFLWGKNWLSCLFFFKICNTQKIREQPEVSRNLQYVP